MNRISYLAAIATVGAADYHSTPLLLEKAIGARATQGNIRSFRYSLTDI